MTRIIGIFVRIIIIFAFANVLCESLNYNSDYSRIRLPRYDTCKSCNREWADTLLTSPWYREEKNYNEVPIEREYLDISERISHNEQVPSSRISTNLGTFDKHEQPSRRGSYNPTMPYSERRKFYQSGKDSFENLEQTMLDPYFTSKTSIGSSSIQEGTLNQYPFTRRPKSNGNRISLNPRNYQLPKNFYEFDDQLIRNIDNDNEYKIDRSSFNRFNNDIPLKNVQSFLWKDNTNDYDPAFKKFSVVYRADQNRGMFEKDNDKDFFVERKIPKSYDNIDQSVFNLNPNSYSIRNNPSSNKMNDDDDDDDDDQFKKLFLKDYLIRNYYNIPKKSDGSKSMRIIDRDRLFPIGKEIVSFSQLDHHHHHHHQDKLSESLRSNDKDYEMKETVKNGDHFLDQRDITNNEEEKLLPMQTVKILNVEDDSTNEESSVKIDPDFLDDIEYPSAEPTESTIPTDESTER
ncbi:hypothetical protein M0802_008920 [Mischocyttarus mexicanus]|nr:hypothetical protein M0802_008920 [Mischocyttarus mexicanus]